MERRSGNAIHAEDDADVLERAVGIEQFATYRTDWCLLSVLEKRSQPFTIERMQSPI